MNILYVGDFKFPDKSPGALKVLAFSKAMRANGHIVTFASVQKSDKNTEMKSEFVEGFNSFSIEKKSNIKYLFKKIIDISIFKHLVKINSYDMVIAYNPQSIANIRMRSYCRKNGIKYVCDIDEWDEPNPIYPLLIRLCIRFNYWLNMSVSNKFADGLFVSSEYLKTIYCKKKTLVIPPLVDLEEEKWRPKLIDLGKNIKLVYFGSGGSVKENLQAIVDSVKTMKGYSLNLVGVTQDDYEIEYNQKHEEYANIHFWGRVSHSDALAIVASSDYSIIIRESTRKNNAGFPTKFVESISLGTPVLCNRFSDVERYLSNYQNGGIIRKDRIREDIVSLCNKHIIVQSNTFNYKNYIQKIEDFFLDL